MGWPAPGPRQARGLQIGIGCLAALSFISGGFAGIYLLAWAIFRGQPSLTFSFPTPALLGFVPPFLSVGLGIWTWRTNAVWRFASITAILCGVLGLGFAGIDMLVLFLVH
jgi:hypothetical protein